MYHNLLIKGTNENGCFSTHLNNPSCDYLFWAVAYDSCFHLKISFHKVTQYNCDFTNKAPPGCNQYFTGSSGEVMSFNFQDDNSNGLHLASQDQTICVR